MAKRHKPQLKHELYLGNSSYRFYLNDSSKKQHRRRKREYLGRLVEGLVFKKMDSALDTVTYLLLFMFLAHILFGTHIIITVGICEVISHM